MKKPTAKQCKILREAAELVHFARPAGEIANGIVAGKPILSEEDLIQETIARSVNGKGKPLWSPTNMTPDWSRILRELADWVSRDFADPPPKYHTITAVPINGIYHLIAACSWNVHIMDYQKVMREISGRTNRRSA